MQADLLFFRRALDRLGVEVESAGVGAYKSAPEQFTADMASAASREQIDAYLDDVFSRWLAASAEARGLTETRLRSLVDVGLFDAPAALASGLIDEIDDLESVWIALNDPPRRDVLEYLAASREPPDVDPSATIAVVHVRGTIVPGPNQDGGLGGALAGSDTVIERLKRAREDDAVRPSCYGSIRRAGQPSRAT